MTTLNVAVIGTGIFAKETHLPTLKSLSNEFNVIGCYNRSVDKAEEFSQLASCKVYKTVDELFEDPQVDVIDVLVPNQFNLSYVELAVKHKKHIIMEKPISATLEDSRKIYKLSKENPDIFIGVNENWLYLKAAEILKENLPKIGKVESFTYNSTGPFVSKNKYGTAWRAHPQHIGGYLSDGGVHQLALLTEVLGPVGKISSLTKQIRKESGTDDTCFTTCQMKEGDNVIGTYTYSSAFGQTDKWTIFKIYGDNGSLFLNLSNKKKPYVELNVGPNAETADVKGEKIEFSETEFFGVEAEFKAMHDAITKKNSYKGSVESCGHHLFIVGAILESSSKGGSMINVEQY
ncbi:hypothetical protein FOG51_02507 [Hanseniaspora uvarum]|jgi:predicted dehydrogenase|nr:hypothetical protein FOG51_02507 [Hanseniaspora uvarum]KAF0279003.1 hypothetical protein FOG50_00141 [Hanseniaspora uvarum]KKA01362.1 hypothetical protein D499_0AG00450 [Hanseniaspora uvarum DSM 2768]